jgi:acyl-CoA hydrolase
MATQHVEIVMASHVNGTHRLFGGQLMAWIDVVSAVEAKRHAKSGVTLLTIDHLTFLSPVYMDETVALEASLTWSGKTSMEVRVLAYVEKLDGTKVLVNKAYLVFVAIDDTGLPVPVPVFIPGTLEEKVEWEAAVKRRDARMKENI